MAAAKQRLKLTEAAIPVVRASTSHRRPRQLSRALATFENGGIMKRRWLAAVVGGFALGFVVGYALGLFSRPGSSQRASPDAKPDRVIAHVDFKAAVAWAAQGKKWTVEAFPVDGLNAPHRGRAADVLQPIREPPERRHRETWAGRCRRRRRADPAQQTPHLLPSLGLPHG